ncbi:hypothetical protein [Nonomuraea sp. NPDC049400]|uniref:hypothetical protein n=1 Tax=Nonomuraea sp. NPDC049400 TaxID=3364352 RepID=UPI0037B29DA9
MTALTILREGRQSIYLYSAGEDVARIPDWLIAWMRLGIKVAKDPPVPGQQTILAVSTPTKKLATAAVALGYTCQRYTHTGGASASTNLSIAPHAVAPGMRIWVRAPKRIIVGDYLGGLPDRIHLSTPKTGAFQAQAVRAIRTLPHGMAIRDASLELSSDEDRAFVRSLLPNSDPEDFLSSWDWSLILVGSPTQLRADLAERISMSSTSPYFGSIGTVVRPFEHTAPVGWRSSIMSARADAPAWEKFPSAPQTVILDGAYAISRWLSECQAPVIIAVVERTELGVEAAVAALMQERSYAAPVYDHELSWQPPQGCEVLAFRRSL